MAVNQAIEPTQPKVDTTPPDASLGSGERLVDIYQRTFDVVPVSTPALLEKALRLRYQVYCIENRFEDPDEHPDGLETDQFDTHADHSILIHRPTGQVAGTVRLVLPLDDDPGASFAMQRICHDPLLQDPERFPVAAMGEISRFGISKQFRRRRNDNSYADADGQKTPSRYDNRRLIPNLTLGLMESIIRMTIARGLPYLCAVMEPPLLRLLVRLGIHFEPIGDMVEFHGKRQPCMCRLILLLDRVRRENREVWEVMTDNGRHWETLSVLERDSTAPEVRRALLGAE